MKSVFKKLFVIYLGAALIVPSLAFAASCKAGISTTQELQCLQFLGSKDALTQTDANRLAELSGTIPQTNAPPFLEIVNDPSGTGQIVKLHGGLDVQGGSTYLFGDAGGDFKLNSNGTWSPVGQQQASEIKLDTFTELSELDDNVNVSLSDTEEIFKGNVESSALENLDQGGDGLLGGILGALQDNSVPIKKVEDIPGNKRDVANSIAWKIAKLLVHNLTQQIVNLIRTGGQGGGPLFVTNWQDFLLDSADQASGVFLKELNLTQLCEPFAPRLRLLLAQGRTSFPERMRCTISGVLQNVQAFYQDFSNGGWARWFEITQIPQNNFYGAYYLSMEENLVRQSAAVEASLNEAKAGSGFLNLKECIEQPPEVSIDPATGQERQLPVEPRCTTVSPGKWLEGRLSEATNADIQQLNLADSFNEIILAAFQTLMQNLFFQQGGLRSSDITSISVEKDLASLQAEGLQISGISSAILITGNAITTKKNSLAKAQDLLKTLQDLRACKVAKSEPLADVDNRTGNASTTIQALNGNIVDLVIFLERLKDDKQAILLSQTVATFQTALKKTQDDVLKTPSAAIAQAENDKIASDKKKAEEDLELCKNPPKKSGD